MLMSKNILLKQPIRTILLWTIKTLHLIQSITFLVGPYITSNVIVLSFLIIGYMLLVTLWYLYGHCIFTPIEQFLDGSSEKYKDGNIKSFIGSHLEKIIGNEKIILYFTTFVPMVNTIVALYKIYSMKTIIS